MAVVIPHLNGHTMKKTDDLVRLAKSLRTQLDVCQEEALEVCLLLRLVGVVRGVERGQWARQRRRRKRRDGQEERGAK